MLSSILSPSILAVETATEACSAALYHQGKISARYQFAPQRHAALILSMCDELLKKANIATSQLSAVAFGCGPGSFTGVRIAAAVTQGIAVAHDLPVIPISSLQALAQAAFIEYKEKKIIAGLDARMGEVYLGKYILEHDIMIPIEEESIISLEEAKKLASAKLHSGSDEFYADEFYAGSAFQQEKIIFPTAEAVIMIAIKEWQKNKIFPPKKALPVYLRNNIVS